MVAATKTTTTLYPYKWPTQVGNRSIQIIKTLSFMHRYPFFYSTLKCNTYWHADSHTLTIIIILSLWSFLNLVIRKSLVKSFCDTFLEPVTINLRMKCFSFKKFLFFYSDEFFYKVNYKKKDFLCFITSSKNICIGFWIKPLDHFRPILMIMI